MPESKDVKTSTSGNRDGLALVIGGLFILGLVFATYTYFNKGNTLSTNTSTEEKTGLDRLKEIISSNTQRNDEDKDDLVVDVDKLTDKNSNGKTTTSQGTLGTGGPVTPSTWVATDYVQGEIKSGSYTVKSGDTLWEIAEAVYGNGAEWTKILNANASSIGTLPSGQQALIMPGQVLNIPS